MSGDFSRWTGPNAAVRHYAGVLMQQARLQTDADWNEAFDIGARRMETALGAIIGRAGTPKHHAGFMITSGSGGFGIAAGHYFLDGAMVENTEDTTYEAQAGDVPLAPIAEEFPANADVLVYLEATRPTVTAREDSRLADPALGGVDTAVRIQAAWRVGLEQVELSDEDREVLIERAHCGALPVLPGWEEPTGRMEVGTLPAGESDEDADCLLPPEAGYLSQENQLYRVQIVRGGSRAQARFVWSRENGSVEAVLGRDPEGNFILIGARQDEALGFVSGGWVEIYDAEDVFHARSGRLVRMTLDGDVASFQPGIGDFDTMVRPRVRRWDHGGLSALGLPLSPTPRTLERGLTVRFTSGSYREGDYWVFEARAATGQPAWPPYPVEGGDLALSPMGWGRRRAPLALARWNGEGLSQITDLRAEFPTLTCLHAEDVEFDDDACNLGADTVQDAIEALCRRTASGLCSFTAGTVEELIAGVEALRRGQSVRICLRGTNFALPQTLVLRDLGHVAISGTGPRTVLSTAEGEPAVLFTNCESVRVTDLSVNGGPTGVRTRPREWGRNGALSMQDCGDVSVERVNARCRNGLDRMASCISARTSRPRADVLIRDCELRAGQSQTGVQIIGARRAVVENTVVTPSPASSTIVRARVEADPVLVSRIVRSLARFTDTRSDRDTATAEDVTTGVNIKSVEYGRAGTFISTENASAPKRINSSRLPIDLDLPDRSGKRISMQIEPQVSEALITALNTNRASAIADVAEFRSHIDNLLSEAVRNNGFADVAGLNRRIIPAERLAITPEPFIAQGIVIAGDSVDEARVIGCRVEGAVDGIRIAASSDADERPPVWQTERPTNVVSRATIRDCSIGLRPLADATEVYGIFIGHVDNLTIEGCDIAGPERREKVPRNMPQVGIHQYGWRGPRVTVMANTISHLTYGIALLPDLGLRLPGVWRAAFNGTENVLAPFVTDNHVTLL